MIAIGTTGALTQSFNHCSFRSTPPGLLSGYSPCSFSFLFFQLLQCYAAIVFLLSSRAVDKTSHHPELLPALYLFHPIHSSYRSSLFGGDVESVEISSDLLCSSPFCDMMLSSRDTRAASPPTRYRAADYHALTNRRASSPPSPDLETAHELALQLHYRRPVATPDKRASTFSTHAITAPCTSPELRQKRTLRESPMVCVEEKYSCMST